MSLTTVSCVLLLFVELCVFLAGIVLIILGAVFVNNTLVTGAIVLSIGIASLVSHLCIFVAIKSEALQVHQVKLYYASTNKIEGKPSGETQVYQNCNLSEANLSAGIPENSPSSYECIMSTANNQHEECK